MPALPATARQCLDFACAAVPAMVGRAVDQAIASLQEDERRCSSATDRQQLADAWMELLRRRDDWKQRYARLLLAQAERTEEPAGGRARAHDDDPSLALVDEDALRQTLEAVRLLQLLAPRLEQALTEFDALMSSALGLASVQPDRNPLRPEVFARSLRELMQPAGEPQRPGLWTRHLAGPMATEIEALYRDAIRQLKNARLEAASYRVLPVASPATAQARKNPLPDGSAGGEAQPAQAQAAPLAGAPAAGPRPQAGRTWADLSQVALGDELFQQFLFGRAPASTQPLAPAYYAEVDAQLATIQGAPDSEHPYDPQAATQYRHLPPVERPHRDVGTAQSLDAAVWGRWAGARERSLARSRLKKQAMHVGQVLGLEVVRKLVEQVGHDPRLLAPVREAIVAVEPSLLKLALAAPRFFGEEQHAGRRLVERVAERSFRYNDEFASEFQEFFSAVRSVFQGLNETGVEDDAPFARALERLEERWAGEDAIAERGGNVAADAVHFAEAREAEAAQIAWTLSQRPDLEGVPAVVQDFLYGPWALVMAHARLTDAQRQIDPGGWNAVISDLLWSVKPEQTLRDPARLFATIPGILERLRAGLGTVGQSPADHETFFAALEKLHRPVLKLRARQRQASRSLGAAPEIDPSLLSTARQQPPAREGEPWMTPAEQRAAGFEEDGAASESAAPSAGQAEVAGVVGSLRKGSWVDLYSGERWRRARLKWVSERSALFMFVSHNGQPHSMTRRSLERLVRDRLLRLVDDGNVVDRAIAELSQQATNAAPPRKPRPAVSTEDHAVAA